MLSSLNQLGKARACPWTDTYRYFYLRTIMEWVICMPSIRYTSVEAAEVHLSHSRASPPEE
jgi:hypothetical protein